MYACASSLQSDKQLPRNDYDLSTRAERWLRIQSLRLPPERGYQSLVSSSSKTVAILFGGLKANTGEFGECGEILNDTWLFRSDDRQWSLLEITNEHILHAVATFGHSAAIIAPADHNGFESENYSMWVFGGMRQHENETTCNVSNDL